MENRTYQPKLKGLSVSLSHGFPVKLYANVPRAAIADSFNCQFASFNIYEKVRKERGEGAFLDFQSN